LRVAFMTTNGDYSGGAEASLALLLQNLPSEIEPVVICFTDGEYAQSLRRAGLVVVVEPLSRATAQSRREDSFFLPGLLAPFDALHVAKRLRELRVALVHTNLVKAHVIGAAASKLCDVPMVMHLRDLLEGAGREVLRFVATRVASDYVPITRLVADWYGLSEAKVIYNPVDLRLYDGCETKAQARRALGLPQDAFIIGMVGRINRWKGHERFLRIVADLAETENVHGVIVGEPRFRDASFLPELQDRVDKLGIRSRLTFLPWLADPRPAYAALDLHCNCSTREPFGRTTVEAAACGVPSICFADGGGQEILTSGRSGIIVPAHDEAAFAAAIRGLLRDPEGLSRMGAAAREASQTFSIAKHVDRMVDVFEGALLKHRARGNRVQPQHVF
jgi:glycosyltransferase involved in cell wall biosynthesis